MILNIGKSSGAGIYGITSFRFRAGTILGNGGDPVTDPIVQSINSNGWSFTASGTPSTFNPANAPQFAYPTRAGFDSSGNATIFTDVLVLTQRIRQVYPNQASLTTDQGALSDYIYPTDTLTGITNNSTEVCPKPVANWVLPDHRVVGNTVRLELVAFHRHARENKQVACVEFRATDGVTTVTQIVNTMTILAYQGDIYPVIGYACDLNLTTLNAGSITVNAKVFPHVGGAASVLNSSDQSAVREFSPQVYLKNVTLAANPIYVYVNASTGNDTTGAVSTTAATAEVSPCLTVGGALNRAIAVNGSVDGVEVRFMAGTHTFTGAGVIAIRAQTTGEVIFTRDPNATKNSVILNQSAAVRFRLGAAGGWARVKGVTYSRGNFLFQGEGASRLKITFEDVAFNNNSHNSSMFNASDISWLGVEFLNVTGNSFFGSSAGGDHLLTRGASVSVNGSFQFWNIVGSHIENPTAITPGTKAISGAILAFNRVNRPSTSVATSCVVFAGASTFTDAVGVAIIQNVFEWCSSTEGHFFGISNDSAERNTSHVIMHHNTIVGAHTAGRGNLFYDDGSVARINKLMSMVGNIHVGINTKGDVFATNGTRVGNWPYLYGVGCRSEFSQFVDADSGGIGGPFAQAYPGLGADIGTSSLTRNNPLFTDYKATTVAAGPVFTAGVGGGDYSLQAGSPAIGKVTDGVLPFDFAGVARSATASAAGAYERLA